MPNSAQAEQRGGNSVSNSSFMTFLISFRGAIPILAVFYDETGSMIEKHETCISGHTGFACAGIARTIFLVYSLERAQPFLK